MPAFRNYHEQTENATGELSVKWTLENPVEAFVLALDISASPPSSESALNKKRYEPKTLFFVFFSHALFGCQEKRGRSRGK